MSEPKVILYASPTCGGCRMAMAYLTALGVPFEVRDVSHNPEYLQEMLELTRGLRGTPVIRAGDRYVRGFDPRKLAALLGKA